MTRILLCKKYIAKILKITISVLIIVSLLFHPAYCDIFDDLSSLEKDTYAHFSAGVVISHISYPFFKKHLDDKNKAAIYSLSLAVVMSLSKEIYDINRTGFDVGDLVAGTLGGSTIFAVKF